MRSVFMCTVMALGIFNFALQSRAGAARDWDNDENFSFNDLDHATTLDDMDPGNVFPIPVPFASPVDRREESTPADTPASQHSVLHERSAGRYCGELTGELFKAEVRAVNQEWLLLRNMYWDDSLSDIDELNFKTTYMDDEGSLNSYVRLDPEVKGRSHQFMYYVRFARHHGVRMQILEVFDRDNLVLLASLNVSSCVPPSSVLLGRLTGTSRGVASGHITVLSSKTMSIEDLVLPTATIDLLFWAGYGQVHEKKGFFIPVDGSTGPIGSFDSERMVIKLPRYHTFYDVAYVAVVASNASERLGHVYLNRCHWRSNLLPPSWAQEIVPVEHQVV